MRSVTVGLAAETDPALARWIDAEVAFPSTMVDRMVPATTDEDRTLVQDRLGVRDEWPVRCEPFLQWVIEEVPGLPPWHQVGATVVEDVAPWEVLKLRLLNGPHSTLAYLGLLAGIPTIAEAATHPALARFVTALAEEEIVPTLPPVETDPVAYAAAGRERFANASLGHRTSQVAMDGSQKLPPRLVSTMADRLTAGAGIDRLALAVAAWMTHVVRCSRGSGSLDDPLATVLERRVRSTLGSPGGIADALLGQSDVFSPALAVDPRFRGPIVRSLERLDELGAIGAAAALT
jgi:fructuronate reductase